MSKPYNGHVSYNAWNISLWLGNDEGLYKLTLEGIRRTRTRISAAEYVFNALHEMGVKETPDGVRYTKTGIRLAMRGA